MDMQPYIRVINEGFENYAFRIVRHCNPCINFAILWNSFPWDTAEA